MELGYIFGGSILEVLSYAGMAFTILAVWLIAQPKRLGVVLAVWANAFWTVFGMLTSQWPIVIQSIFLLAINVQGYINWKKAGIQ